MSWDLRASERSRVLAFMFLPPTHCLQGLGLPQPPWNVPSSWHSPVPKQRAGVVWTSVGHLAFFGSGVLLACLCHFFSELIWGCKRIKEGFVLLTLTLEEKKSVENLTSAL